MVGVDHGGLCDAEGEDEGLGGFDCGAGRSA